MKFSPYAIQSTKKESEHGGRCGSRAAGPEGIAGRCIDLGVSIPPELLLEEVVAGQQFQTCCHRGG